MKLMPITPALRDQYELDDDMTGVLVTSVDPGSEAASKGLKTGDVMKRVGSRTVHQPVDVSRSIEDAKQAGRESVLALIAGEEGERFVALRIAQG
jgi:serine protease Do